MVDLDIEGNSGIIGTYGGLDIKGYSFSLMCWIFAMLLLISFT